MKKIFLLAAFCVAFSLVLLGCSCNKDSGTVPPAGEQNQNQSPTPTDDGVFSYALSQDGEYYVVTGLLVTDAQAVCVPDMFGGKKIKAIGEGAFESNQALKGIIFEAALDNIGKGAFQNCKSLTTITFNNGVCTIGEGAFEGCTSIKKITLPDNLNTIGIGAFSGCTSLKEITVSDGAVNVGERAFENCTALTTLNLSKTVEKVGAKAFCGCSSLNTVNIFGTNVEIHETAFENCQVKKINVPMCCIGAFDMKHLINVTIRDGEVIKKGTFSGSEDMVTLTLPGSIKKIETEAFVNAKIRSIEFSNNIQEIENGAFKGCTINSLKTDIEILREMFLDTTIFMLDISYAQKEFLSKDLGIEVLVLRDANDFDGDIDVGPLESLALYFENGEFDELVVGNQVQMLSIHGNFSAESLYVYENAKVLEILGSEVFIKEFTSQNAELVRATVPSSVASILPPTIGNVVITDQE